MTVLPAGTGVAGAVPERGAACQYVNHDRVNASPAGNLGILRTDWSAWRGSHQKVGCLRQRQRLPMELGEPALWDLPPNPQLVPGPIPGSESVGSGDSKSSAANSGDSRKTWQAQRFRATDLHSCRHTVPCTERPAAHQASPRACCTYIGSLESCASVPPTHGGLAIVKASTGAHVLWGSSCDAEQCYEPDDDDHALHSCAPSGDFGASERVYNR